VRGSQTHRNNAPLRRGIAIFTVLLALLGIGASAASAEQVGVVSDITWGTSRGEVDQTISLLKESGAKWIRANVPWNAIEANGKGVLDTSYLSNVDYAIEKARAAGLEVEVPIADGVPYWASADPHKYQDASGYHYNRFYRPSSFQDYAEFVAFVVNRYKGMGVHVYEVWNEPNNAAFWPSGPNAGVYAEMLEATYPAIKQADPGSTVLMGGLSKNDYNFLQALYEAGAGHYFDAVNVHPYAGSVDPTLCWKQPGGSENAVDAFCGVEAVYNTMARNGDSAKKIWLTEFGYSTCSGSYCVSEAQQAEYLTKAYRKAAGWPYVQALFWYQMRNWGSSSSEWTDNLGLLRSDFTAKPAYAAFRSYATGSSIGGGGGESSGGATAPSVQLSSPANGSSFSSTLYFAANASDAQGVTKVEFWLDGHLVHTSTTAPYAYAWSVPKRISYGAHTAKAIAFDAAGLSATATATVTRVRSTIALTVTSTGATTASAKRHRPAHGRVRLVKGHVPAAGRGGSVLLRLERLGRRHRWQRGRTLRVRLGAGGRFRRIVAAGRGRWRVRAVYRGRGGRLISGYRYFNVG
jgi:polysaccharide biosynthesis protein PslG